MVHFDHTKLMIRCPIRLHNGRVRKIRPWLSLAIDVETRAIVGFYLSVHHPSTVSCMMLCRDIVERYGRMPSMIVVDNGKEFHSWAFDQLLIATRTNIRYRPPHQARFGAVMERMFGTTEKRLIHNLAGNTKAMLDVRKVTAAVNPINADAPTLPQLHGLLEFFFFEQYANEVHPAIQDTPQEYMERRLTETGWRLNRIVTFDLKFRVLTCPPPIGQRTRKVDHLRGVRLGRLYYWCDEFSNPKHRNATVELKLDPWNAAILYAKLDGKWVRCKCALFAAARRISTVELRYMTDSLRESMRRVDREPTVADIERIVASRSLPRNASVANKDEYDIEQVYEKKGMGSTYQYKSRPNATRSCPKQKPAVEPSVAHQTPKLGPNDQYPMQ
jgi:transposase InsO family protein